MHSVTVLIVRLNPWYARYYHCTGTEGRDTFWEWSRVPQCTDVIIQKWHQHIEDAGCWHSDFWAKLYGKITLKNTVLPQTQSITVQHADITSVWCQRIAYGGGISPPTGQVANGRQEPPKQGILCPQLGNGSPRHVGNNKNGSIPLKSQKTAAG